MIFLFQCFGRPVGQRGQSGGRLASPEPVPPYLPHNFHSPPVSYQSVYFLIPRFVLFLQVLLVILVRWWWPELIVNSHHSSSENRHCLRCKHLKDDWTQVTREACQQEQGWWPPLRCLVARKASTFSRGIRVAEWLNKLLNAKNAFFEDDCL